MKVFLALPAYNEEQNLPELLRSLREEMAGRQIEFAAVVVDDGSRDGTLRVLREWSLQMPVTIVEHAQNQGLGVTIADALRTASSLAAAGDVVVTMDADNTHSPALIATMLDRIAAGADLVIASRYQPGAKVVGLSRFRSLMSDGARVLFQAAAPIRNVRDYTCGFRAYRASLLQLAFARFGDTLVTERSFACMAEILLKISKLNPAIAEVPMVLRYDQKQGASKMPVARSVIRTLRLLLRQRFDE